MPNDPSPTPENPLDGLAAPQISVSAEPVAALSIPFPKDSVQRVKGGILFIGVMIYLAYFLVLGFFAMFLPSPTGELRELQSIAILTSVVGAGAFVLLIGIAFMRISKSPVSVKLRQRSLIFTILALAPGIAASLGVALLVSREPPLGIDIVSPATSEELVAPVSVTLSAENAAQTLRNLGYSPMKYQWDSDGDGKTNAETVEPITSVVFHKQGVYTAQVMILLEGNGRKIAARRIIIPQAVFSYAPLEPVVERAIRFDVAHLLPDVKQLKQVTWDFGDATRPEVSKKSEVLHTFYAVGDYPVTAVMQLLNNTEYPLKRTITVREPPPLPFPVTLIAQPKNLLGPSPFGALFRIETEEPVRDVEWNFGDGKVENGPDLLRIGHTFDSVGVYPVTVRVRSASGQLAELSQTLRVTETLQLSNDLRFEGSPAVQSGKVTGELPLELNLTPKTSVPLVTFLWEVDDPTFKIEGTTLTGVFREEGTYTAILVGQDADGKVMRYPLTVDVKAPSAELSILALPDNGVAPLKVKFDASQSFIPPGEEIAGFKWSFGDEDRASEAELGAARVEHIYEKPGEYDVVLSVVLVSGKEVKSNRTIVVRKPSLTACITTSRVKVQAGKGVEFDSACTAGIPSSYVWDVRSAAEPTVVQAQAPTSKYIHVFERAGEYTVSLTVKDEWGNLNTAKVTITVTP